MEEDILKYSPTVMFRGTPCIKVVYNKSINSNSLCRPYHVKEKTKCRRTL